MNKILSERQYEDYIVKQLVDNNDYVARTNLDFDRYYAIDRELLLSILTNY